MNPPVFPVAVIMEKRRLDNRWVPEKWEPAGVVPDVTGHSEQGLCIVKGPGREQFLYPGFELKLFNDEIEGYYLNISSPEPKVFVMWRMSEQDRAIPFVVTLSYHEAARMMDGGESVDAVAMPADIAAWLSDYVHAHYKPEPKKVRKRKEGSSVESFEPGN